MNTLAGYPYVKIEFIKEGTIYQPEVVSALLRMLNDQQISDLIVISHGWNNDMKEAQDLYEKLMNLLAIEIPQRAELANRKFAVLGVFWPSKKFAEEDLIPGGGAASIAALAGSDELISRLEELRHFFDGGDSETIIQQAIEEARRLDANPDASARYVSLLQTLLSRATTAHATEPEDYAAGYVNSEDPLSLLTRLSDVSLADTTPPNEGAADLNTPFILPSNDETVATGMNFSWNGIVHGARNMLNFVTYYQMKERAGKVGVQGLHPVLLKIKEDIPNCRIHLIGHSFGARLVTAATAGPNNNSSLVVDTLTLLQAAFSHYSFAENYDNGKDGLFRNVIAKHKVKGPIIISCTHNDKAVGLAYAIASRIARQSGEFLGDKDDYFGGMGANGAQKTPNAEKQFTLDKGISYNFKLGKLYNLNADNCIDGHSNICQPQVANAIISSIATM